MLRPVRCQRMDPQNLPVVVQTLQQDFQLLPRTASTSNDPQAVSRHAELSETLIPERGQIGRLHTFGQVKELERISGREPLDHPQASSRGTHLDHLHEN